MIRELGQLPRPGGAAPAGGVRELGLPRPGGAAPSGVRELGLSLPGGATPSGVVRARSGDAPRAPNVFLAPARATDPPPPWARKRARARPPAGRSLLPLVTLALAAAICLGLSRDDAARERVVAQVAAATSAVGAFFVQMAIR